MNGIQPYQFKPEESLQGEDDSDCLEESPRRTGNTNWCLYELCVLLAQMTSERLTFLLPAFESAFRCIRNGGPAVICIISLYLRYQIYFVIIIVEFLITVLSITYLRNII